MSLDYSQDILAGAIDLHYNKTREYSSATTRKGMLLKSTLFTS